MPAARIFSTGAVPLASFMLLSGLCETPTSRRARIAMSAGVSQTPCAATVRGPQNPIESRNAVDVMWYFSRDVFTSSAVSAR